MLRSLAFPMFVSLVFALACSGAPTTEAPPPAAPPPPVAPAPPAPPAQAADPAAPAAAAPPTAVTPAAPAPAGPFLCCDHKRADQLVNEYLDLQRALTKDDDGKASGELSAVRGVLLAAQKSDLDAESKALVDEILVNTEAARAATGIEGKRTNFKKISTGVITLAKKHKGGSQSVREAWCPMAEAGWLQEEAALANPYYGAKMLTCGSFR